MSDPGLVHIIDDDDAVRDGLAALMRATGRTVATYSSAPDFLAAFATAARGVVITDLQMPEMSGLDLLQQMNGRLSDFPTIVLTGAADVPVAVKALKAGAADLIEKPFDSLVVLAAVQKALQGLATEGDRDEFRADCAQRMAALSAREREVLRGLVAGLPNKAIARDLGISPRTVETYRANIMMKMQATSLSELVRMSLLTEGG